MAEKPRNKLFTLAQAGESFGLDLVKFEDCARWIIARLHPEGTVCPHYSAAISGTRLLDTRRAGILATVSGDGKTP
jgi:hypothetical protein